MMVNGEVQCCGCLACKSVCAQKAISLVTDEKGFIYPQIDKDLCNNCGACKNVCEFSKAKNEESNIQRVYSFKLNERTKLLESTSGGAFTALSDYVLERNGVVVGAIMDDNFQVYHKMAEDECTRNLMRKSKYVQSNTEDVFEQIVHKLKEERMVMFVGTPCQVAQLVKYVGGNKKNLFTCDFLCHGVPNNAFFKKHIQFLESEYGKTAKTYFFRGKKYGWTHMMEEIEFMDGSIKGTKKVQAYSTFFYSGISLRPSCLNCRYRTLHRFSDITLADFWGIDKITGVKDNEGVSMISVNTERGSEWVEKIKSKGVFKEVDIALVRNKFSEEQVKSTIVEAEFWEKYCNLGYKNLVETYTDVSMNGSLKHTIKKIVKKVLYGV